MAIDHPGSNRAASGWVSGPGVRVGPEGDLGEALAGLVVLIAQYREELRLGPAFSLELVLCFLVDMNRAFHFANHTTPSFQFSKMKLAC